MYNEKDLFQFFLALSSKELQFKFARHR